MKGFKGHFLTILSATSIPEVTSPKTVYFWLREGASATQMKNCDPALSGCADLAMERMPLLWGLLLNSAFTVYPGPPVPCFDRSVSFEFGSPPWIMNLGMTRWKRVPS